MKRPASRPLSWWHPAVWIATGFGVGLLPIMPGTWASLAALLSGWEIVEGGGRISLGVASIIAFGLGWWAAGPVALARGQHDPGFIVIDEIAAQWLVLLAVPLDHRWYGAAFLLFRVFDIVKPWPIRAVERRVVGGLGIMLDDVMAAIYALLLLLIGQEIFDVRF